MTHYKYCRKAIIPAAGLGTRLLPLTKAIPKEMIPIQNKPIIHYIVEELVDAGIKEIFFVVSAGKGSIQEYFHANPVLEKNLVKHQKHALLEYAEQIVPKDVLYSFVYQKEMLGLGDAILSARDCVTDEEPFLVVLPDELFDVHVENPSKTLIDCYNTTKTNLILTSTVEYHEISRYGIVDSTDSNEVIHLIEKPSPDEAPSNQAVIGRYLLHGNIMGILSSLTPGRGGEVQLTDGLSQSLSTQSMYHIETPNHHFDCGNIEGFVEANIYFEQKKRIENNRPQLNLNTNFYDLSRSLTQLNESEQDAIQLNRVFQLNKMTVDFSNQQLTHENLNFLINLARNKGVKEQIKALVGGGKVNNTENKPALHTALRGTYPSSMPHVKESVEATLKYMETLADRIREKQWLGYTSKPINHIVHIGIGGSYLGPKLLLDALSDFKDVPISIGFVSSIDPIDIEKTLEYTTLETTLFIVASKSFTTEETLSNFNIVKQLYPDKVDMMQQHFIAITANVVLAQETGFSHIIPIWDWVGGRYSIWSAMSFSSIVGIGMKQFRAFLQGARDIDNHTLNEPVESNIPVLLGMVDVWNINYRHCESHAIVPYSKYLEHLVPYLSQLFMESLGKGYDKNGVGIHTKTGAVIWGGIGTNSQHSFHQMLMQGTHVIPVDFILVRKTHSKYASLHKKLIRNCQAQIKALTQGHENARDHKRVKPNLLISLDCISPYSIGALISLYEHRVYTQAAIWNINPFDQHGVETVKEFIKKQDIISS